MTWQRTVGITGTWGYSNTTETAGNLVGNINDSITTINISDSSLIGVGDSILIGTEQMFVTGKSNSDTGAVLMTALEESVSNDAISISNYININPGEIIQIDSEKMYVISVSGTTITVKRGYESTLASHADSTEIYRPNTITVSRGTGGTTKASHLNNDPIYVYKVPEDIEELCVAETIVSIMESESGYGLTVGSDRAERNYAARGITELRTGAQSSYYIRRVGAI